MPHNVALGKTNKHINKQTVTKQFNLNTGSQFAKLTMFVYILVAILATELKIPYSWAVLRS